MDCEWQIASLQFSVKRKCNLRSKLCFGAMLVQVIMGGSGTLRTDYPGLILLLAAFFFPVGLVS